MTRTRPDTVHLPPAMKYDCLQCGRGCSDFWEIPVDAESEARLSKLDLKPHQQRARDKPPFETSSIDHKERVLCRVNDVCTFLAEDKKCALHAALGPKNKPQTCIDFPFRYVDTPAGPFIGVTFACTAILREHGAEVETRREELRDGFATSAHIRKSIDRPRLTQRLSLSFDAYLELEKAMDAILCIPTLPIGRRLLCQSILLEIVTRAFTAARLTGEGGVKLSTEEQIAAQSASDLDLVRALVAQLGADNWARLLARAVKRTPFPPTHRAFLGLVTTFRQALWRNTTRLKASLYIFRHYIGHAMMMGGIHMQPMEFRFDYAAFRRHWPDASPGGDYDRLLTRYFRHTLFRKDLLLTDTLTTAHRFQLLHFALFNWYAVGMTAAAGKATADEEILQEALRNVEKYYVHHTTFTQFLEKQPLLGMLVDSVLHNPRYAASMCAPPIRGM